MTYQTTTLRPGLLVQLKTSLTGNTSYYRRIIDEARIVSNGAEVETTEVVKTVRDPVEDKEAKIMRAKCSNMIRATCTGGAFLLCPQDRADNLRAAIADARYLADSFNERARTTKLSLYVVTGEIKASDVEAIESINSEIRDLLSDMEQGVKALDPAAIRAAANSLRSVGMMLSPDAMARVQDAIDRARTAARAIVKAGETAALEVDSLALARINNARTAFLDLDNARTVSAPEETSRAIDLSPDFPLPSDLSADGLEPLPQSAAIVSRNIDLTPSNEGPFIANRDEEMQEQLKALAAQSVPQIELE